VAIDLPAALGSGDGSADLVDQVKQAITQFLKPVDENGLLCIVKDIVAWFNRASHLQQTQPLNTVLVNGYVQPFRNHCRITVPVFGATKMKEKRATKMKEKKAEET
jgi:hypothetical protein